MLDKLLSSRRYIDLVLGIRCRGVVWRLLIIFLLRDPEMRGRYHSASLANYTGWVGKGSNQISGRDFNLPGGIPTVPSFFALYFASALHLNVKQLYPPQDSPAKLTQVHPISFGFHISMPEELKSNSQQRDIIRIIVAKGKPLSGRFLELPHIWNADMECWYGMLSILNSSLNAVVLEGMQFYPLIVVYGSMMSVFLFREQMPLPWWPGRRNIGPWKVQTGLGFRLRGDLHCSNLSASS